MPYVPFSFLTQRPSRPPVHSQRGSYVALVTQQRRVGREIRSGGVTYTAPCLAKCVCLDYVRTGLDDVIMSMTRGCPTNSVDEPMHRLRHRPSGALLKLLDQRLQRFDPERVTQRAIAGETAIRQLSPTVDVVGGKQTQRTHWLFALSLETYAKYTVPMRAKGFDSARGTTSITALAAPQSRRETHPKVAHRIMDRLLFIPMYPEIRLQERERLVHALIEIQRT